MFKKSYEIAYALWRISANIPERIFAAKISEKSVELLSSAAAWKYDDITAQIPAIEILIRFGSDVGVVSVKNADILLAELINLKAAIIAESGKNGDLDIADIFSEESGKNQVEKNPAKTETSEPKGEIASIADEDSGKKAEMRQVVILQKIRQMQFCRLGDIQAILPDVSERTIRYDIETLVQQGTIERVGTGGRSIYYRAKA